MLAARNKVTQELSKTVIVIFQPVALAAEWRIRDGLGGEQTYSCRVYTGVAPTVNSAVSTNVSRVWCALNGVRAASDCACIADRSPSEDELLICRRTSEPAG